jgi:tetratricopeptide (TPR) repeat protein
MRRLSCVTLFALALLAACSRQAPCPLEEARKAGPASTPAALPVASPGVAAPLLSDKTPDTVVDALPEASKQERYDAALLDALNLLADRKLPQALNALRAAQQIQDTDQVQRLLDRIQTLMAEQAAAERTAQDLKSTLGDGKADEAARLAVTALSQYGGSDAAGELVKVQQQAEALVSATADDSGQRRRRLLTDAQAALQGGNLRAASISFEQALALGDDASVRSQLDDVRGRLNRYDECRRNAQELRRDPGRLEEALTALRDAGRAWDTLEVRQEIDDYTLALQKRRDRVGVTDFEVRGDLGVPGIGRSVAEELLPGFKSRFDVVERAQVARVLDELKLEGNDLLSVSGGRQEVGRLAGVRYLVVGSLTPLCGVTVQARLVEVRTGLIVQTARVSAPSVEALMPRLPLLAQMLMMSDEQKLAFELAQAQRAPEVQPIEPPAALPPPPPPPVADQPPPPPLVTYTARPPALGGLVLADFNALPPIVAVAPPPPQEVVIVREEPRRRLFALSLELGDNLFRRGHFREAQRHFSLALTLGNDRAAVQLRIDRCQPYLPPPPPPPIVVAPPPPVVVVAPAPPPVVVIAPPPPVRPRVVVFNFLLNCDPGLVPPSCGDWAADHFGACFGSTYEVIDRGEVCWYMGRLGITMREVLNDPSSRIALAQALNVRFYLFGAIEQTHSFNVTTHLIDAQTGARTGTGTIHVQDANEMKLRMHELARQVGAAPAEQARLAQQGKDNEKALNEARKLLKAGSFTQAAAVAREALKTSPDDVALKTVQQEAEQKARQVAQAEALRREAEARKAEQAAAAARQKELARQAEAARQKAEAEAKAQGEAARRAQELQKQKAAEQLREQARKGLREGNPAQAVGALQSALALRPGDDVARELALARAEQEKAVRNRAAEEQARKEAELKKQREAAQAKVEAERKQREAEEAARRKALEERDQAEYARRIEQARGLLARKQFDSAVAALQTARQMRATEEVDRLLQQARDGQAQEEARKKGAEAERRLAEEKARRDQAEVEAKRKQQEYLTALDRAQKAMAARNYDEAVARFQEAEKLFRTDVVINGLAQAQQLRDRDRAGREAEQRRLAEEKRRAEKVQALLAEGRKAAEAGQYDRAIQALREANGLTPGNVEVLTALSKAEQARDEQAARARIQAEQQQKQAALRNLLNAGQAQLAAGHYDEAAKSYQEVLRSDPRNAEALAALREIDKARAADGAAMKKRRADYDLAMDAGRGAMKNRNYPGAINAFTEALRLMPGDRDATALLKEAQRLRDEAAAAVLRGEEFKRLLTQGQAAMAARRYADAVNAYNEALKIQPGDPGVTKALRDAQQAAEAMRNPPKPAPALLPPANPPKAPATPMPPANPTKPPMAPTTPPPPPPPDPQAEYAKAMQAGAGFDKQKKFADAVQAYRTALRWKANDPKAATALRNADYLGHMTEGEKFLAAKRFADATKEFEEALKLFPNSNDAKTYLQKAKSGKP